MTSDAKALACVPRGKKGGRWWFVNREDKPDKNCPIRKAALIPEASPDVKSTVSDVVAMSYRTILPAAMGRTLVERLWDIAVGDSFQHIPQEVRSLYSEAAYLLEEYTVSLSTETRVQLSEAGIEIIK